MMRHTSGAAVGPCSPARLWVEADETRRLPGRRLTGSELPQIVVGIFRRVRCALACRTDRYGNYNPERRSCTDQIGPADLRPETIYAARTDSVSRSKDHHTVHAVHAVSPYLFRILSFKKCSTLARLEQDRENCVNRVNYVNPASVIPFHPPRGKCRCNTIPGSHLPSADDRSRSAGAFSWTFPALSC